MWLLTPTGFYSAVVTDDRDVLAVRTRTLDDARRLVDRVFGDGDYSRLISRPHADYRHRVLLRREQWTDFVADEAAHIDYGNFKQAVAERQGWAREAVYADVCATLHQLPTDEADQRGGAGSGGPGLGRCWSCGEAATGTTRGGTGFCLKHRCEDCHSCGRPAVNETVMGTPYCDGSDPESGSRCRQVAIYSEMTW